MRYYSRQHNQTRKTEEIAVERIRLTKTQRRVIRLLSRYDSSALDTLPRSDVRRALRSLDDMGLTKTAWIEGGDFEVVRLTISGRDYMIENPKLRNPVNRQWVITTAIATVAALLVSFTKLKL